MKQLHYHGSIELFYVKSGSVNARIGAELMEIGEGNLIAVSSLVPHDFARARAEYYQLIIPREFIPSIDKLMENKSFDRMVIEDPDGQLLSRMKDIYEIDNKIGIYSAFDDRTATEICISAAINLLRMLVGICGLKDSLGVSGPVVEALQFLSLHFREQIGISDLSRIILCNRSRLSSLFFKTFGMSMSEYLNKLRAAEVKRLISENPEMTLIEAAELSGFGSLRSLHRAYRSSYGETPRSPRR